MAKLLVAIFAVAISATGVALAASSPTVSTGGATKLSDTAAVVHGRVNPNGNSTGYVFDYGITIAYGQNTPAHSVGHGSAGVNVSQAIGGLTPGTTYHYRILAENKAGTAYGADHTFTTTGHPPAVPVTGSAVNVRKTVATVTGSVDPEDAPTYWTIQYGLTSAYGVETFGQNLPVVSAALPVSGQLSGLAPATLFHYRIVAFHGDVPSAGGDQTFFTEPLHRYTPKLSARTSPSVAKHSPYSFTTAGTLKGAGSIPAAQRCTGSAGIRYFNGHRQLAFAVAQVGGNCRFSAQVRFKRLFGPAPAQLKVTIDYRGNGYIAPVDHTDHVIAG